MNPSIPVAAAALALLASVQETRAVANPQRSAYSTIEIKACTKIKSHADGDSWSCPGVPGYPLYVAEGDLRFFVSAGRNAEKRRAATQTLNAFNTIFAGKSTRATLEWRVDLIGGRQVPYATILRYYTSNDSGRGQVLVVSKVGERESCQVAWIDAVADGHAIELARQIADTKARTFDCKSDPAIEGARGKSPM